MELVLSEVTIDRELKKVVKEEHLKVNDPFNSTEFINFIGDEFIKYMKIKKEM